MDSNVKTDSHLEEIDNKSFQMNSHMKSDQDVPFYMKRDSHMSSITDEDVETF